MCRADVGGGARMCSYSSCASRCYAGGSGAKQLQSWRLNLFEQLKKLAKKPPGTAIERSGNAGDVFQD